MEPQDQESLIASEETGREQLKRRVYINLTELFSRSGQWKRNSAIIAVIFTIITINFLLLFNSGETSASVDIAFPQPNGQDTTSPPHNYTKEVYATLLSPGHPHPWTEGRTDYYFEAVKIIAHRILRNTTTRDPFNRRFVVLVTESVPRKQRSILESHGCLVRQVTTLDPPVGTVNLENVNPRYRDQFTKMHIWNMTEYDRIAYFDGDTLPIQPFHTIFDTPTQWKDDEEWLFAAVYDSGSARDNGQREPPGPDDKGRPQDKDLNAGVFLLKPTPTQSEYIFSMFRDPPAQDFTRFMEQDLLRWAYRDDGPYPWMRLSHQYNTQWPRIEDVDSAFVLHDKLWGRRAGDELRWKWYEAWGEMVGWDVSRLGDGIQGWEEGRLACDLRKAYEASDR